jgi:hypothetical protein
MMDITAAVAGHPDRRPDASQRPPIWAYENPVTQAELVINGNGW